MTAPLKCARCHRSIAKPAATVAGMPLGPKCAATVGAAMRTTPLEAAAARADRRAAEAFRARQLSLLEPATQTAAT